MVVPVSFEGNQHVSTSEGWVLLFTQKVFCLGGCLVQQHWLFRCNDVLVFTSEIWSTVEDSINLCTLCRVAVHNCIKRISHFENHVGLMLRVFFRRKLMGRYSKQACDFKIMNPFLLIIPCISHQHPTRSRQHLSYYEYQQGLAHDSLVGIMCDKGFKS